MLSGRYRVEAQNGKVGPDDNHARECKEEGDHEVVLQAAVVARRARPGRSKGP
jgi:hypothetical protein